MNPGSPSVAAAVRRFRRRFGENPQAVSFAPGRINIIGEHVDYCGLPVLPAALGAGIAVAFRHHPRRRLSCVSRGYGEAAFDLDDPPATGFGRYPGAAASALRSRAWLGPDLSGVEAVIASDLPEAAGLSSSSALVVATALALLAANGALCPGERIPPVRMRRLARDLAASEHGVAIAGGAMDQSVSLGAVPGHALHLAFDPPAWEPVPIDPDRFRFIAVFCGRRADKGAAAGAVFDERVRESHAALREARRMSGAEGPTTELVGALSRRAREEVIRRLPAPLDRRLRHILSEADRTERAVSCLCRGDARGLGVLLDASHESLRRDYEVSTPELDALVAEARAAGAFGARLTGAGFGGSAVVLTAPASERAVRRRLRARFGGSPEALRPDGEWLLDGAPSGGAVLLPV